MILGAEVDRVEGGLEEDSWGEVGSAGVGAVEAVGECAEGDAAGFAGCVED